MITQNKRLVAILALVSILLLIPFVAMQFTNEVNWSLSDFIIAGFLLLGTGLLGEFIWRKVSNRKYRLALLVGLLVALFLVWAELAVGIFGTPFAGS